MWSKCWWTPVVIYCTLTVHVFVTLVCFVSVFLGFDYKNVQPPKVRSKEESEIQQEANSVDGNNSVYDPKKLKTKACD